MGKCPPAVFVFGDEVLEGEVTNKVPVRGNLCTKHVLDSAPGGRSQGEVLDGGDSVAWALNRMAVGGFRHVPVVDAQRRPVGMVSVRGIVEVLADFFPEEVYNLPPEPTEFLPMYGG